MKRAILLMLLLVGAAIFVPVQTQAAITIPANLVMQLDPVGDVFQISETGAETIVTGRGEIDILSIEVEELPASTFPPQPAKIKLTMVLQSAPLVNPDVSYIFLVGTPATTYAVLCNYSDIKMTFAPFIINLEAGEPVASPLSTATTTGNQVIAEIVQTALGNPSSITSFRAITVDNRNEDYKYGDMAPDKLVKVTSPSEKATIWQPTTGNYVFSGICSKSQLDFTSVEASINNGASWHAASTIDGWKTWSISFSVASLSGQNKIMVRATDTISQMFRDELTFFVDNTYLTETNRPKIPEALANMVVGTVYTYETEGSPGISGIELSATTQMTMEVQKKETVVNPDRTYETLKLHTSQSGSAVIGVFSISQSVERDSWRPIEDQQTIVKEYTVTTQSVEKDGSPLNSAWSFTNATYASPGMDPGFLGKRVGSWWESSTTATQDTKAVDAEGQVTTRDSTSTKSMFNEFLYRGAVSSGNAEGQVPALTSTAQCYFVKSSNGDNSTSFSISVYSDNYPVPLRIEAYDGNRDLVGVLRLKSAQAGDGTFFGIDNVEWPSGKPPANEEISISVTIRNEGTSPGATWVALVVDGSVVSNVTSGSINSGETAVVTISWVPVEGNGYEVAVMTKDALLLSPNLISIGPPVPSPAEDFMLYGLIAVLVLVAAVVLFVAKKRGENKLLKEHDKKQGKAKNADKESGRAKPEAGEISIEVDDESIEVTSKKEGTPKIETIASQPATTEKEPSGEKTPVKCSKCGSSTKVFIDQKPYKFKCPDCGAKLMIK